MSVIVVPPLNLDQSRITVAHDDAEDTADCAGLGETTTQFPEQYLLRDVADLEHPEQLGRVLSTEAELYAQTRTGKQTG